MTLIFAVPLPPSQRPDHSPSSESALPAVSFSTHCSEFLSLLSPASFTPLAKSLTSAPSGLSTSGTSNGLRVFLSSQPATPASRARPNHPAISQTCLFILGLQEKGFDQVSTGSFRTYFSRRHR